MAVPEQNACIQLFDPCTKEPIANMNILERRIREIKKHADTIPIGQYGLTNDTSNYDFITKVFVNSAISLDDMVSFRLGAGGQVGSDIFEVLCRLFVFLGGIDYVNPRDGGNYKFMNQIEWTEIYDSTTDALKKMKCKATRAMGISDITLTNINANRKHINSNDPYCEIECSVPDNANIQTYLMSVKWYKDEKNAEHYDLEKLYTASHKITTAEQKPVGIIVFLKSKTDFELAHNRSYRQYVREIGETFFGWYEDVKPFLEEKRRILFESAYLKGISPKEAFEQQYFIPGAKPNLSLQLHQDIIVKGLCDALDTSSDNLFLVGVLPRGGKTYIAGGIIREYLNRNKIQNLNIFWITAAVNETRSQVKGELLDKFQDFDTFEFIDAKEVSDIRKTKPHTFIYCSSQLLIMNDKRLKGTGKTTRQYIQDFFTGEDRLGLLFFDEVHKTGTGDETKQHIKTLMTTYSQFQLPFIFLTATYYNILFDYKVLTENTFLWDYTDILATRALGTESEQESAIANLRKRFGSDLVNDILQKRLTNGDTYKSMAKAYIGFPDVYFLSADFNKEAIQRFEEQNEYRPDSGFSLHSIFAIKPESTIRDIKTADNKIRADAYKIFENLDNPRNMIAILTPSGTFAESGESGKPLKKEEGSVIEPSIFGRINKASRESQSRFRLDEKPTILMFMPVGGTGSNIYYLLCAWASLLMSHSYWKENYEVACVVEEELLKEDDVRKLVEMTPTASSNIRIINNDAKSSILKYERELHCEKNKGLIVLAGEKLSMGISLPCTDVVCLFNDKKSPDDIIQKMYRALTPSIGKKSAYVVDLNPVRTLAALYGYTRASHKESNTKSEILDILYDTYSWDGDVFDYSLAKGADVKPLSFQDRLRQLFETAEKDDIYNLNEDLGGFEKKLADNVRRGIDPDFVHALRGKFSADKLKESLRRIGLTEGSTFQLDKTGKLVIQTKVPKPPTEEEGEPQFDEVEIIIENFIETLTDFVKYLSITSGKPTIEEAIAEYESNAINSEGTSLQSNVLKLVKSRTKIKADDEMLSKILVEALKDFAFQSSSMVYGQMKGKVDEKSVRKNAVLKIIHRHLTPRKKQKEEKGEVFTPVELIEEMLTHLPTSVWKNPNLKWLDPANGIGNFPIVAFYKLDEGLKSWEPNETKRRKHIIENMLYMLEIQSNNSRIARNLFEKLCDGCKPNILTTNSLEMTSEKLKAKGFPEKYNIIIGNPPFNAGGLQKGGGTLWPKFVKLAFQLIHKDGYIVFIHPPGWRKFYNPDERDNQGKILHDIRENNWNLDYVKVSDKPPKHFPIVDFYVIHAKNIHSPTKYNSTFMGIEDSGEIEMDYPFIPSMLNSETFSILDKLFSARGDNINIVRRFGFQPNKKDEGKPGISHFHFMSKSGEMKTYKKEYSSMPDYIDKPKVFLQFSSGYEKGRLFSFYSDETLGVTDKTLYMLTYSKTQAERLVKFFNSDIITFLMKITQYSGSPNHTNEFKILNLLKVPESMEEYHLTEKEQALINKVVGVKEEIDTNETGENEEDEGVSENESKGGFRFNKTRKLRRR